tara:strand:- start:354 stop:2042 length:1689 start_codon:yes stop_codon:yes gene_type:complete
MAGGLLNIVSYGNQNVYLNGNPSKTFFKTTYKKYTNFGLQKFRLDFDGLRKLRMTESSLFTFRMKRYAELLMDTYLVVTLPTIWSPIYPPQNCNENWAPYEFKWIENLGTQMIQEIEISVGGQILNKYSGDYLLAMIERDFSATKKKLYDEMSGNVSELNDPANTLGRINLYPNAYYTDNPVGPEPSIRARKIYIPMNTWFTMAAKMAFPLVALQYNELEINVRIRPVQELFVIRDVLDQTNNFPYIQPKFNEAIYQFYRFLQPPPDISLNTISGPEASYVDRRTDWNADVHLVSTYAFLSEEESKLFASKEQKYLFKSIYNWKYYNVTGTQKVKLDNTIGMVSSWMWTFQRNDINLRNEWSNYSNWAYNNVMPGDIVQADASGSWILDCEDPITQTGFGPGYDPSGGFSTGYYISGNYNPSNEKNILLRLGILLDGKYRENVMDAGIYEYLENYRSSNGMSKNGLYTYSFAINNDPYDFQPSGAMNMSKFTNIELEFTTWQPQLNENAEFYTICDPSGGGPIGVNKSNWMIYDYNYDLTIHEERYNILTFVGGNCGLMYAR